MENLSEKLVYMPNRRNGECLFNGKPEPTDEIMGIIGENGVKHIHKKLSEIVDMRKELFGDNLIKFYGLFYYQQFYDLQQKTKINVYQAIDNRIKSEKQPYIIEKGDVIKQLYTDKRYGKDSSDKGVTKQIKSGIWIEDDVNLKFLPRGEYGNLP